MYGFTYIYCLFFAVTMIMVNKDYHMKNMHNNITKDQTQGVQ